MNAYKSIMGLSSREIRVASAVAPAKLILMGEHFVVYGCPAIAIPVPGLELQATLRYEPESVQSFDSDICSSSSEIFRDSPNGSSGIRPRTHLQTCVDISARHFGMDPERLHVEVCSSIPVGSGLGSSAAVSVAVARAVAGLVDGLDRDELSTSIRKISIQAETLAHGKPSGIDTEVCITERAVRFVKGLKPDVVIWQRPPSIGLVLMNTGVPSSTSHMVARASEYIQRNSAGFERLREDYIKDLDKTCVVLGEGDYKALGVLADRQHERLKILEVSSPELEKLVITARALGAHGAKLSGAGGGGVAFAVCAGGEEESLGERLRAEGIDVVKATRI